MTLNFFLLFAAVVIVLCVGLNNVSSKLGIPMLLAFMALGMLFGTEGPVLKVDFNSFETAETICTIALIFIIFYGGFGTRWTEAKPVALKSGILASLGTVITAAAVGIFARYILGFPPLFSYLIGAVLSSTDAASVFAILRSKKLGLKYNTASMLEIESGSNDPFSYMLTIIMMTIVDGAISAGGMIYTIFAQIIYGAAFGFIISYGAIWLMRKIKITATGFDVLFIFGVAILSYALPSSLGGNGYLSAYIAGIVLGNTEIYGKKTLVAFFDGVTNLMQVLIFFLLGLLVTPSKLPEVVLPALAIAAFMTLVARPIAIFSLLGPFKCKPNQMLLTSFVGLRGAASIVFAIMATPAAMQIIGNHDILFNIVFTVVLFSIGIQGSLIPFISKKCKMIDDNENILKTFTDYAEDDTQACFIEMRIRDNGPWIGHTLKELKFPRDILAAVLIRGKEVIIPNGRTIIEAQDRIVFSTKSFIDHNIIHLSERKITKDNENIGKKIFQYSPSPNELVVLIRRGEEVIIPKGDTVIRENDILVINSI